MSTAYFFRVILSPSLCLLSRCSLFYCCSRTSLWLACVPAGTETMKREGVRQSPEDKGVLQAVPGQVPPQARGKDRLPGAQEVDLPGQEQVQLPQVQARRALHQQVRAGTDHLRHHPGRHLHVPGLVHGAPQVRLQGRTQELRRGVLHRSPRGPSPAPPAGEDGIIFLCDVLRSLKKYFDGQSTQHGILVILRECFARGQGTHPFFSA